MREEKQEVKGGNEKEEKAAQQTPLLALPKLLFTFFKLRTPDKLSGGLCVTVAGITVLFPILDKLAIKTIT